MKNLIFISITLFVFSVNNFSQIYSTYSGGLWNDPNTWVGGVIPDAGNDVVIEGPVVHASASGYTILTEYCNNLTITSNGSLRNGDYGGGSGIFPLVVFGNVVNNGLVENGASDFIKISITGDLENNNIWMPYQTEFQSPNNHNLSLASGKSFGSKIINNGSPSFTALTDMLFTCDWNAEGNYYRDNFLLNGQTFNIGNHSINLKDCMINSGTLIGNFEILGKFTVGWADGYDIRDTLVFNGNITVTDTLCGNVYGGGYGIYTLKIIGNVINNGVIKDDYDLSNPLNNDDLRILITGNIYNHGVWENNFTNLVGTTNQFISSDSTKIFDCYFTSLKPGGNILATSNLTITKDFNLNGNTLDMQDHKLTISGWLYNGTISNTILHNGFLQNIISINNLIITGTVTVDDGNVVQNTIIIEDTLQSNEYGGGSKYFILPVNGEIINHGVIKNINSGDMLSLELQGNLTNTGKWQNSVTKFAGSTEYHITSNDKILDGDFFVADTSSIVLANSDLTFSGNWNLGGSTFDMQNLNLALQPDKSISNAYLKDAKIRNGKLSGLRLLGGIEINGTVEISFNVDAIANIIVNDTLTTESNGGGTYIYNFTNLGNFENNGFVGQIHDDLLTLKIGGNIINKGVWTAYQNYQLFYPNHSLNTVSFLNTGSSNWLFNGSNISGNGASAFSITSGGGVQTVTPNQSYDLTIQFNSASSDTTATLSIGCNEIGTLNTIYLIGHNYNSTVDVKDEVNPITPNEFVLYQNYPNPFNPSTTIRYTVPNVTLSGVEGSRVQLKVYDMLGKEVATLVDEYKPAGVYEVNFDGNELSSGIYFYQLKSGNYLETKKMTFLK